MLSPAQCVRVTAHAQTTVRTRSKETRSASLLFSNSQCPRSKLPKLTEEETIHALDDGIVTGNCHALCRAALHRTQVVDECNAPVCSFVATLFHVVLYSLRSLTS